MQLYKSILFSCLLFFSTAVCAAQKNSCLCNFFRPRQDLRPWSILFYAGRTAKQALGNIVVQREYTSAHETVVSAELARTLYKTWWGKLQLAGNLATRFADSNHYPSVYPIPEADVYLMLRIIRFPWSRYIDTTLAAGEGVSYAAEIPFPEAYGESASKSKRFLDFLTFELTFALPSHTEWQLVARIHHRSGGYTVFAPDSYHAGSNTLGVGIRYYF